MSRIHDLFLVIIVLTLAGGLNAQENPSTTGAIPASAKPPAKTAERLQPHKFWDKENIGLFAGVAGVRMLDYASTRHLRNQGNNEWLLSNSVVDNRPLFVGIELTGAALSIGVSYLFHRTGHHTLERWTSIAHIGVGVGGSVHNYLLKPPTVIYAQPALTYPTVVPTLSRW